MNPTTGACTVALIPAAGRGTRFSGDMPKQYIELAGETVLSRTISAVAETQCFDLIVIVISPDDTHFDSFRLPERVVLFDKNFDFATIKTKVPLMVLKMGGKTRAETVANGLKFLVEEKWLDKDDTIAVHDAARCSVNVSDIQKLLSCDCPDGAILATPCADTLKIADESGRITETISRENVWQAQTPQVFRAGLLHEAMVKANLAEITDEASAVEKLGHKPQAILGNLNNIKLTRPEDKAFLEQLLEQNMRMRVGQGCDVHRLVEGRPLILGGVEIPFDKGLDGHSDADALLHAIIDALLGAVGMGDIGSQFPDTDEAYKNANSGELLQQVWAKIQKDGWQINNIDTTIIAQTPKLAEYIPQMKKKIGELLKIADSNIGIKAKTNEKLGYLGRSEAIEAQAAVLLQKFQAA